MVRILLVVLVLMAASVYSVHVIQQIGRAPASDRAVKQLPQKPDDTRTVVIKSENGHFAADARVDGHPIAFMVDTGASLITIRASDADALGYRTQERDYVIRINTANGEGRAAPIELSRVEIGDITVRDVPALVVPDAALGVNLLGMSFLSRVHWSHERGQLVLEQ
jgi:aspartyl protease family protein